MKAEYKIGDIIEWDNVTGKRQYRIVEVWDDIEPRRLLVTDPCGTTMRCYTALTIDCRLVERPEFTPTRKFKRNIENLKEKVEFDGVPENIC
jgi:hypothetical protein